MGLFTMDTLIGMVKSSILGEGLQEWLNGVIYRLDYPKGWDTTEYVALFPKFKMRQLTTIHHSPNRR
jgi:hypothetical protein